MRALSIRPHFAALIASGLKVIEGRTWGTSYRGPLAIHATKTWGPGGRADVEDYLLSDEIPMVMWEAFCRAHPEGARPYAESGEDFGEDAVHLERVSTNAIVAVAMLAEIKAVDELDGRLRALQAPLCDFETMTHAWVLHDIRRLAEPITPPLDTDGKSLWRGGQGLWTPNSVLRAQLDEHDLRAVTA